MNTPDSEIYLDAQAAICEAQEIMRLAASSSYDSQRAADSLIADFGQVGKRPFLERIKFDRGSAAIIGFGISGGLVGAGLISGRMYLVGLGVLAWVLSAYLGGYHRGLY